MKTKRELVRVVFFLLAFMPTVPASGAPPHNLVVFDDVVATVRKNFYDPNILDWRWDAAVDSQRNILFHNSTDDQLMSSAQVILERLQSSHTGFYSPLDQDYHALKSIFALPEEKTETCHIGAWFKNIPHPHSGSARWFVKYVFDESPAEKAGLKIGDLMLDMVGGDPFEPVRTFYAEKGSKTTCLESVRIEARGAPGSPRKRIHIQPLYQKWSDAFLNATKASGRFYDAIDDKHNKGGKVGYIHVWAGGNSIRDAFVSWVKDNSNKMDSLILDLRDGFGGMSADFVDPLFFHEKDDGTTEPGLFQKPLVVLVNEGTRSGKEWIVGLLARNRRATFVGSATAGAFLRAKLFDIHQGEYVLYLPTARFGDEDFDRIEGRGIAPDVSVPFNFKYAEGADPQLEEALRQVDKLLFEGGK